MALVDWFFYKSSHFLKLIFPKLGFQKKHKKILITKYNKKEFNPDESSLGYEIDVYREGAEDIDDVDLDEFSDEIDGWIIDELKAIGCDSAKSVLEIGVEDLVKRTVSWGIEWVIVGCDINSPQKPKKRKRRKRKNA